MPAIPKADTITATTKAHVTARSEKPLPNFGVQAMVQWLYSQMRSSNKDVQETLRTVEASREKLNALSVLQQALRDNKTAAYKDGDTTKTNMGDGPIKWGDYQKPVPADDGSTVMAFDPEKGWVAVPATKLGIDKAKLEEEDWYQALSPAGKAAAETFIMECNAGDGKVQEKQVDKLLDKVKEEIAALNSDNELQMINLQHVMQTRNQAIQLASNIISVLDRAADVAINNMGK